jgi:hypothetical protein
VACIIKTQAGLTRRVVLLHCSLSLHGNLTFMALDDVRRGTRSNVLIDGRGSPRRFYIKNWVLFASRATLQSQGKKRVLELSA